MLNIWNLDDLTYENVTEIDHNQKYMPVEPGDIFEN